MPTADREGLREALTEAAFRHAHVYPEKVCWAEVLRLASAIPDGVVAVAVEAARANADTLIAGPLSALLAQADNAERMEAERDEARALIDTARGEAAKWPHLEKPESVAGLVMVLAAAARQAPLGERGNAFVLQHLTRAVDAAARLSAEVEALRAGLERIKAEPGTRAKVSRWAFYDLQNIAAETLNAAATTHSKTELVQSLAAGQDKTGGGKR